MTGDKAALKSGGFHLRRGNITKPWQTFVALRSWGDDAGPMEGGLGLRDQNIPSTVLSDGTGSQEVCRMGWVQYLGRDGQVRTVSCMRR